MAAEREEPVVRYSVQQARHQFGNVAYFFFNTAAKTIASEEYQASLASPNEKVRQETRRRITAVVERTYSRMQEELDLLGVPVKPQDMKQLVKTLLGKENEVFHHKLFGDPGVSEELRRRWEKRSEHLLPEPSEQGGMIVDIDALRAARRNLVQLRSGNFFKKRVEDHEQIPQETLEDVYKLVVDDSVGTGIPFTAGDLRRMISAEATGKHDGIPEERFKGLEARYADRLKEALKHLHPDIVTPFKKVDEWRGRGKRGPWQDLPPKWFLSVIAREMGTAGHAGAAKKIGEDLAYFVDRLMTHERHSKEFKQVANTEIHSLVSAANRDGFNPGLTRALLKSLQTVWTKRQSNLAAQDVPEVHPIREKTGEFLAAVANYRELMEADPEIFAAYFKPKSTKGR